MSASRQYEILPPLATTLIRLEDRNDRAVKIIESYAKLHTGMDVAVGLAGTIIPGAAIPSLIAAIASQSPVIYQPMARDLTAIYTAPEYAIDEEDINVVRRVVRRGAFRTGAVDIGAEFGTDFMMHIAGDLLTEIGLGALASLCVPVLGAAMGATLDYLIANMMTWRVGTMVSLYYQNGENWLSSRSSTFEAAKNATGSLGRSIGEIFEAKRNDRKTRVDLNALRNRIPEIANAQVQALKSIIEMMHTAMTNEQIRAALIGKGIPVDIIEKALSLTMRASAAIC